MKKKLNVYSSVAEAINDFSTHRLNKLELYEIICNCLLEITNEEKEQVLNPKTYGGSTDYQFAKNWLHKK
jgi:hypothetical protein